MAPAKTIATRFACTLAPHASFSFARFPGFTFITVQHRPQWNLNAHGARPDSAAHVGPARQRPPVGRSSTTVTRIPDSDVEKPGSSGSVSSTGPEVAARRHGRRCGCDRNRSPPRSKSVTLDTRHVGGAGILRIRAFPIRPWRPVNRSSNGPATDEDCDGPKRTPVRYSRTARDKRRFPQSTVGHTCRKP